MQAHAKQVLTVEDLSFGYTKTPVWQGVSFSLAEGELAFLKGENGSGKSTLLRCLAGWSAPHEGSIELCGRPFTGADRTLRSRIGFVPDVPSFYEDLTASEHIRFVHKTNHRQDRLDRAERLLEDFGLAPFGNQYPSSYSRGMREKLGLVIALSLEPSVLLLDEPYGPLDRASSERLSLELKTLLSRGAAVVLSCHHEVPALEPDCSLHLHEGRLLREHGADIADAHKGSVDGSAVQDAFDAGPYDVV